MPATSRHDFLALSLAITIGFLVFFKPIIALTQYAAMDDQSYMKIAADFVSIDYPDAPENSYPPGVAVAWLPASLMAVVYRWLFQVSETTALPIFVGLLSYAYLCASLFLLAAIIRMTVRPAPGSWRVGLESVTALLGVPLLYYGTHRTSMVHAPEFFFALLTAFFVLKKQPVLAFGAALMSFSLRLNDVPALLFALAPLAGIRWTPATRRLVVAGAALVLCSAFGYVLWLGFVAGYNRYNFAHLLFGSFLERIPAVLFGGDWGLLWTGPAWLLCLIAATVHVKKMSLASRFAALWMLCELLICFVWPGNGSDFGYRYLIGSYAGAIVIACDLFGKDVHRFWKTAIRVSWALSAGWLTWVTWIYKERPDFTPYPTLDRVWTHPDLMWNSFKALFSPDNFLMPLPHSTLGAIYYTLRAPQGPFALPGGIDGPMFQITVAVCAVMAAWTVWLGARRPS